MSDTVYLGNPNLKKANVKVEFTQENIEEFIKCKDNPVCFVKNYIKIVSLDEGLVNFNLYPFQEKCLTEFKDNRYNIILKARQLVISTLSAGYALWMMLFHNDKNILVIGSENHSGGLDFSTRGRAVTVTFGGGAGAAVATLLTPVELIKCRMQMEGSKDLYKNDIDCFIKSTRNEGLGVMFKVLAISILQTLFFHFCASYASALCLSFSVMSPCIVSLTLGRRWHPVTNNP